MYQGDITKVKTDVIVNAANKKLDHIGGVAYAISKAAGFSVQDECNRYVSKNGDVPVSQVMVTKAGALPYKCIIHAVGPEWKDPSKADAIMFILAKTFTNAILCANEEIQVPSMALPPISSGSYFSLNLYEYRILLSKCPWALNLDF